jgi:hypothetical protein
MNVQLARLGDVAFIQDRAFGGRKFRPFATSLIAVDFIRMDKTRPE